MPPRVAAAVGVLLLVLGTLAVRAGAAEHFPAFTAPLVDAAGVVPDDVEQRVDAELNDYQARTGNQVAVAVVKSIGSTSLEDYSIDLARAWGVGQKGKDNGVLVLIAYGDHKLRIEVGRGLEGTLTDLTSGRIIRDEMTPRLRAGDVGGAIEGGTLAVRSALGDPEAAQTPPPPVAPRPARNRAAPNAFVLLAVPFIIVMLMARMGRRRRWRGPLWYGTGIGWGGARPWGSSGGWGGGFGGGGGGFGGGGGGGFGGGGASGSW